MGRYCCVWLFLVLAILLLKPSQGMGRYVDVIDPNDAFTELTTHDQEGGVGWRGRKMVVTEYQDTVDYPEPGANTNPRDGDLLPSPPPPGTQG